MYDATGRAICRIHLPGRRRRFPAAALALTLCAVVVVACGTGSQSPRPGVSSTPTTRASLRPATTPTSMPTREVPSLPASSPSWPAGWDAEFCATFAEIVVAQELAVDVGRALDEGANDDALALARELEATAQGAGQRLGELPEWAPFADVAPRLGRLMEIADGIGRFYVRYIDRGREGALERVGELIAEQRPIVGDALVALAELEDEHGLSCPEHDFALESP